MQAKYLNDVAGEYMDDAAEKMGNATTNQEWTKYNS